MTDTLKGKKKFTHFNDVKHLYTNVKVQNTAANESFYLLKTKIRLFYSAQIFPDGISKKTSV